MKKIRRLNRNKVSQKSEIPIRIIKGNAHIFVEFLCKTLNSVIKTFNFPTSVTLTDIIPLHKTVGKATKKTIDQSPIYQFYHNL